ncbi:MAG: polysaccharide deacetylase family protein [Coriobacteriia bacterium]|nr:polysaccharide deacetylase family protein [Coriobacteriia bacterium]
MSDTEQTHHHRLAPWLLVLVAFSLAAIAFGFVISKEHPVPVTIDGSPVVLSEGTTVANLEARHLLTAQPGRLLSVSGSVVETLGGAPARVLVNGRDAEAEQYLFRNDVIVSESGADTTETTVTVTEPIPVKTRITGRGPVVRLANMGSVGIRRRVVGAKSNETVSEEILKSATDMVVVKTRPHPHEKLVALTFDDGPWPGQTDKILKILEKEGIHATFFFLGVRVKQAPKLARQVAEAGNQIGNHSLGHRNLKTSKPKVIRKQIEGGASVIYEATGVLPTWFRPPYGAVDAQVWKQVRLSRSHGVMWTVDPQDWSRPGVKKIVSRVTKRAKKGSIILLHDGGVNRSQTVKALPKIIKNLKKRGFVFVTVEELVAAD